MNIAHRPLYNTAAICEHYSKKDGVPIKYVCTTSLGGGTSASDIFYRETPHPEFGNRYFGITMLDFGNLEGDHVYGIHGADVVEDLTFDCIFDGEQYHYSQHRWDFFPTKVGAIDGGRAYTRLIGTDTGLPKVTTFVVRDGEMEEMA
jgi:hypothetical protein